MSWTRSALDILKQNSETFRVKDSLNIDPALFVKFLDDLTPYLGEKIRNPKNLQETRWDFCSRVGILFLLRTANYTDPWEYSINSRVYSKGFQDLSFYFREMYDVIKASLDSYICHYGHSVTSYNPTLHTPDFNQAFTTEKINPVPVLVNFDGTPSLNLDGTPVTLED
jgi:hypothetical protein